MVEHYVVRQFNNKEWLEKEPDLAIHEAESIRMAAKTAVVTPEILAYDETGEESGVPLVIMTRLDGTVELMPQNMQAWLGGLAETLVKIHEVKAEDLAYKYFAYNDVDSFDVPNWSSVPETWQKAIKMLKNPRPNDADCFLHRDYHPANILWENGKVSGVVDWVNACRGPRGIDVGHCRLNLAMLYSVETSDGFLTEYIQQAGRKFNYHPYWDLLSLIDILFDTPEVYQGWIDFGLTGLTNVMMAERLDRYVVSLVESTRS